MDMAVKYLFKALLLILLDTYAEVRLLDPVFNFFEEPLHFLPQSLNHFTL